jgi:hypothetical protein
MTEIVARRTEKRGWEALDQIHGRQLSSFVDEDERLPDDWPTSFTGWE